MVEREDTGWLTVLEKKGLYQEEEILENYGIDSETDVSLLDPESLFSIFNTTYNDDQKSSHTDYIELSIQSQFNKETGTCMKLSFDWMWETYSDMDLEID